MQIYIRRSRIRNDLYDLRIMGDKTRSGDKRLYGPIPWGVAVDKFRELTGEIIQGTYNAWNSRKPNRARG